MRNEHFSGASRVSVTGQADEVSISTSSSADGVRVQLVPLTPGDSLAQERIEGAEVRDTLGRVVVRLSDRGGRGAQRPDRYGDRNFGRNSGRRGGGNVVTGGQHIQARTITGGIHYGGPARAHGGGIQVTGSGNVVSGGNIISGGGQTFTGTFTGGDGGAVRIMVTMPARAQAEVITTAGDIDVRGHIGGIQAQTMSGDVHLQAAHSVDITTQSGDVYIGQAATGSVTTMSGDITATADGHLTAQTMSGDITGRGRIQAHTMSGTVRVR